MILTASHAREISDLKNERLEFQSPSNFIHHMIYLLNQEILLGKRMLAYERFFKEDEKKKLDDFLEVLKEQGYTIEVVTENKYSYVYIRW